MSESETTAISSGALALRAELQGEKTRKIGEVRFGDRCAELRLGDDSLWAIIGGVGGTAISLRCAWAPGASLELQSDEKAEDIVILSSLGTYRVRVSTPAANANILRVTTRLTPSDDVKVPWWPRDLFPLGSDNDPAASNGEILAAQRGLNTALLYGRLDAPAEGSFFYLQDLTALNDYFNMTGTEPDGVVGGEWPELGYCIPATRDKPLLKGEEVAIYDTFLRIDPQDVSEKTVEARIFLEHQAAVYPFLHRPEPQFHDWPGKAEQTLQDLAESPLLTTTDGGFRYLRPYVDAEAPDSMVQVTVTNMIWEYGNWKEDVPALLEEFEAGIYRFFDPQVGAVRRYLNTVGPDKDADAVDSWYLYHPLQGLAKLAHKGDEQAKKIFLASMDYAIKVGQIFEYEWPITFKMSTLQIKEASREPGKAVGQTDAGGLYAYVMLEAYEFTGEERFLEEAKRAICKTKDMEFEVVYQTNLTSWGAAACMRLWKVTGERFFLDQSYVFLASFAHNCAMWEPSIGKVREPQLFLGATCLHNGPYIAPYECYESFCAFHECLALAEDDLPDMVKLLLVEFIRYALERGWWFYPASLQETSLAHSPRNGEISRDLAIPLEDLYVNGDAAGQVGQEVYGCGAAFAYASYAFHKLDEERMLFCEYPVRELKITSTGATFRVAGPQGGSCNAQMLPPEGAKVTIDGKAVEGERFEVQVGKTVQVRWGKASTSRKPKG